jgi:hypothetical protein
MRIKPEDSKVYICSACGTFFPSSLDKCKNCGLGSNEGDVLEKNNENSNASEEKKRIKAVKTVLRSWIEGCIKVTNIMIKSLKHSENTDLIKTDISSMWFFLGSADALSQAEDLITDEDFLQLTKDIFNEFGFSKHIYNKCIDTYVANSWSEEELDCLMQGGNSIKKYFKDKDEKGFLEYSGLFLQKVIHK